MQNLTPIIVGGLIGIVGSIVGIVGSFATSAYLELAKQKAERKNLTGAIVGEISALIEISERRGYIEHLRRVIAEAKAQPNPDIGYRFYFSSRRNSFSVYDANLGRLGVMPDPLPRLIVQFYTQTASILEDIADMRESTAVRNRDQSIQMLEALLKLFEDTRSLGKEIISKAG